MEEAIKTIDELGRVTIPFEFRKKLNLKERQPLAIELDKTNMQLRLHSIKSSQNLNLQNTNDIEVRRIDELRRVVLPIWFRRDLSFVPNDRVKVALLENKIHLSKQI